MSASRSRVIRFAAAALATVLVGGGLAVWQSSAATADPLVLQSGELVVNGTAEQPAAPAWTGTLGRATHGVSGYPASVIVDSSGATGATFSGGAALFTGAGASSVASQTVSFAASASAIDNGHVNALLSVYIGGYAAQVDNARVRYDFRNAGGVVVDSVLFGPVLPADRGKISGFVHFSQTQALPVGTRDAVITITTQRFTAPANDGYVDNVSLILDAPSPVASPDTASTLQGTPVTLTPYANDTPGAGAAIVPSSVRLLDGAQLPVDTLTTADGTYVVNTTTGAVEFTPVPTFYGTTTPVPYRITDSSGQIDNSTMTIDVAFVAVPELTLVKSASPSNPADFTLGTVVTYSFVVSNTGNTLMDNIAINELAFSGSDALPAATCPVTTLEPGEQTACTTSYTITADDVAAGGLDNTATASGIPDGAANTVQSNPSSFEIPVVPAPAISLVKSANIGGATHAGDAVNYSFVVTNTGNVAVGSVAITESVFSGTGTTPSAVCPAGSIIPGEAITCTAPYALTQADVDAGVVTNTAAASAAPASGGTVSSPDSTATVTIAAAPSLSFTKTADRASVTAAGQSVIYSFGITNAGNVTLVDPVINETSFSGTGTLGPITCATNSVAPASTLVCTATYVVTVADMEDATLSNSANVEIDTPTATLTSQVASVAIPIVLPTIPDADPPTPGEELAFTGSDSLPPALFAGGLLAAGALFVGFGFWARRSKNA